MCICPSCESNTYVKPDGVNASNARDLRFAWGEGCCYEAIYSQYICFGPTCPAVLAKHKDKPHKLVELQSFVKDGVFLRRGGPNPPDALGHCVARTLEKVSGNAAAPPIMRPSAVSPLGVPAAPAPQVAH